jgi:uncharacterized membrane protein
MRLAPAAESAGNLEGSTMAQKQLVLAVFDDETKADSAVETIKGWESNNRDQTNALVRIDSIGVLVLDDRGKLKVHKAGARSVGKGAGIGMLLAMVTPPGLIAGLVVGGALGAMHRKGLGLDDAAREQLGRDLQGGKAAVGVLAAEEHTRAITDILADLGGTPEVHDVSGETLAEAESVADEAPVETTEAETTEG